MLLEPNETNHISSYVLQSVATVSASDLVSYLVTGRPSVELTETSSVVAGQRAIEFLSPTFGALASQLLRYQLGGCVDQIQLQLGAYGDSPGSSTAAGE